MSRAWVGFHDAELSFDGQSAFEVELLVDVAGVFARGQRFAGRYAFTPEHVLTSLALPA